MESQVKLLFALAICCKLAWPQVETGTVVVYVLSQKEITVAADSRSIESATREERDDACKIRAFGQHFFFAMAGPTSHKRDAAGPEWSIYIESKTAWRKAIHKSHGDTFAQELTNEVAGQWLRSMRRHEGSYMAVASMRPFLEGNTLASAIFAGTDAAGNLGVTRASIAIDLNQFDKSKEVRLIDDLADRSKLQDGGSLGLGEIADQYSQSTIIETRRRHLPLSRENAEIAYRLVELTIKLHPRKDLLGGEIDELRLTSGAGITWIHRKGTCKQQD